MAAITIDGTRVDPGRVVEGSLHVGELADGSTDVVIRYVVIAGRRDGPVVYLHGGAHGQETPYAVELMRRLRGELAAGDFAGAIVAVPLANPLAHQFATRVAPHYAAREGVGFAGDLHKLWPGDPAGSLTQRIAHRLWTTLVAPCDVAVDFHAVGHPGLPFTFLYAGGRTPAPGTAVWARTLELARAFGLTVVTTAPNPTTLAGACLDAGKPAFMVEMTLGRWLDEGQVRSAYRGTLNVLAKVGCLDRPLEPQTDVPVLAGDFRALPSLRANRGGFIRFEAACGARVLAGQVIARVCDPLGREREAITMPQDGYVMTYPPLSWVGNQSVATGDLVADIFA